MRSLALGIAAATVVAVTPLGAQQPATPDTGIARAVAAFDAGDVGAGVAALRAMLGALPDSARAPRARARVYLGAAAWWQGERDSSRALFRAAVEVDPFVEADTERFNPDVVAAFRAVRRHVAAIGVRAPADVTLRPDSAAWPLSIAVGRPGSVRVRLQGTKLDSVLIATNLDSSGTFRVALVDSAARVLEPGTYRLVAELVDSAQRLAASSLVLTVERMRVDTAPLVPPPQPADLRVESRQGSVSRASIVRGLLLAGIAAVAPMAIAASGVPGATVKRGAAAVGASLAVATIAGAIAGRPVERVEENIRINEQLREIWTSRNRAIAAANDRLRRYPPLRLRTAVSP